MNRSSKILVCGARGMVGSALVRKLLADGYQNVLQPTRQEVDFASLPVVTSYFEAVRPEYVFVAAAKVGGILANSEFPADFIRDNLSIELAVIEAARRSGVAKLLLLGSSCIYPRESPQPIREEYLLTGPLEPTNAPYAVAKIAGIILCQSYARQYGSRYVSAMPTNLYGPGDNFDLQSSHVIPALLRKFHEAKVTDAATVTVWGTGRARREFLYVDDLAEACLFLMDQYEDMQPINVGVGEDIPIQKLAELVGRVVGYRGEIQFDPSKPDGTLRKLLDVSRLSSLGWRATTGLEVGLEKTYAWYLASKASEGERRTAVSASSTAAA